jgi:hypothetical protein
MHLLACQGHEPITNFLKPRLAQSHTTVVIPLYKRVVFAGLLNCSEFSDRVSEISQTLDAITWDSVPSREQWTGRAVASWLDLSQQLLRRVTEAVAELCAVLLSAY